MANEFKTITVIITNHERKAYVKDAITSIINSRISVPDEVEIILVMDYRDSDIEDFARNLGVRVFYTMEVDLGKKLEIGIRECNGDIICFLDDDDMYNPEKIPYVKNLMEDPEIAFVHNNIIQIGEDDTYNSLQKDTDVSGIDRIVNVKGMDTAEIGIMFGMRADWYLSSMSIRADVARKYARTIGECRKSLDKVIFLVALLECKKLVVSAKSLTYYRKHISITGIKTNLVSFSISRLEFTRESLRTLSLMKDLSQDEGSPFIKAIELMRIKMQANALIYGEEKMSRKEIIEKLKKAAVDYHCSECRKLIMIIRLGIISRKLAGSLYQKIQTRGI